MACESMLSMCLELSFGVLNPNLEVPNPECGSNLQNFPTRKQNYAETIYTEESEDARESLFTTATRVVDGEQVSRREEKFPLSWSFEHFRQGTDFYYVKFEDLSEEDRVGLKNLMDWVGSFVAGPCVYRTDDEEGNRVTRPVVGKDGKQVFAARYIHTRDLLSCTNGAARAVLLDNMASQATNILKMLDSKKSKKGKGKSGPGSAEVVDLSGEKIKIPPCWALKRLFEKSPLEVDRDDEEVIMGMDSTQRGAIFAEDIAGLMRLVSSALVLNRKIEDPSKVVEDLKRQVEVLKGQKRQLTLTVEDLEGKSGVWLDTQKRLREDFEGQYLDVLGRLTAAAKFGYKNAVSQLKVVNPGLATAGTGFWRRVENGKVILPEESAENEAADFLILSDDEEEGEEDNGGEAEGVKTTLWRKTSQWAKSPRMTLWNIKTRVASSSSCFFRPVHRCLSLFLIILFLGPARHVFVLASLNASRKVEFLLGVTISGSGRMFCEVVIRLAFLCDERCASSAIPQAVWGTTQVSEGLSSDKTVRRLVEEACPL
ncbi:unnamed protein product [Trifolium pratense]|uniref:Uncharacterized protein n=1 Tax=Trifolium pratense TaxID=57577 RepID=A0ACB0J0D3_TRIPR|nr:unnamed protein product [Trifolium pratense]